MKTVNRDEEREERISMEIVVDAYDEGERAMGWYYYLQDKLQFPFKAHCILDRKVSPLAVGDQVEVVDMAPEDECLHEVMVEIKWGKKNLAIPLAQLKPFDVDDETQEAVDDWHYWVGMGYGY
jgi:hypothetical protein